MIAKPTLLRHGALHHVLPPHSPHACVRVAAQEALSSGQTKSNGKRLNRALVEIGQQILAPETTERVTREGEFANSVDLLDDLVAQYREILETEKLSEIHLSTILFMSVKASSLNGITPRLLSHHRDYLISILDQLQLKDLDNRRFAWTLAAIGKLGPGIRKWKMQGYESGEDFLEDVVDLCKRRLMNLKPQEITNVMTGLANLNCTSAGDMMATLTSMCRSRRSEFKAEELCSLAWALGKLKVPNGQALMESLAGTIRQQLSSITPLELSQFIWACGRLRARISPVLMGATMMKVEANIRILEPESVTNVLWALSRIPFRPRFEFLDMVEVYFANQIAAFDPEEVSVALHALATFSYTPQTLLEVSKAFILDYREYFSLEEICQVVWSLSILDALDMEFLNLAVEKLEERNQKPFKKAKGLLYLHPDVGEENLQSLFHCLLHLELLKKQEVRTLLPQGLVELCRDSWTNFHLDTPSNPITNHILHNFEYMGYTIESPYMDPETGWMLDCVRNAEGALIAVEVVNEANCFVNEKHRLQGPQKWRHKVLRECGWPLMIIYEDEWMAMDFQDQADYLADNVLPLIN